MESKSLKECDEELIGCDTLVKQLTAERDELIAKIKAVKKKEKKEAAKQLQI